MKELNLKAVGEQITAPFIKLYETTLNRIAVHSTIYKELYNRFELDIDLHHRLVDFKDLIESSKSATLITNMYKTISPGVMEKFDYQIVRLSEPFDIIVVSSEIEKYKVEEAMRISSGAGAVYTIDEINQRFYDLPVQAAIYVFSSVWIKDMTKLVNLLYKIESDKEKYLL